MTPHQLASFFRELRRRNVIRVGLLYLVGSWLLLQVAAVGIAALGLPEWTGRFVLLLLALGLPVVLVFSWIFELTPEGLRLESRRAAEPVPARTGEKLNVAIAVLLVAAIGIMLADRLPWHTEPQAPPVATEVPEAAAIALVAPVPAKSTASIAVLPFVDISPGRDQEYFSDGLTEELLNSLARVRALRVVGRTSSFAYKGEDRDLRVIGQELGVDHLLEGSVRKAGTQLRITAQLISAADGYHLWSETYDRELSDVFAIQSDIAGHVAEALQVRLLGEDATRLAAGGTTDLDAYNEYLLGMHLFHRGSHEETAFGAVAAFERALEHDPGFVQAWDALGNGLIMLLANGWGDSAAQWQRLEQAAAESRRLGPELAGGHMLESSLLAFLHLRWVEAIQTIHRAVELEPGNAGVAMMFAIKMRSVSRGEAAISAARRAVELEPLNESAHTWLGLTYLLAGNCGEAEIALRAIIQRSPDFPRPRYYLGLCRYLAGDYETALELFRAEPLWWMSATGQALALHKLGRNAEAASAAAELPEATASYQRAQVAAQQDEPEQAFRWLEHALAQRDLGISTMLTDPLLAPLRSDPRYRELLERVGLLPFAELLSQ
jgi:adenylate cyclase